MIGLRHLAEVQALRGRERAERKFPGVTSYQVGDDVPGFGRIETRDEAGVKIGNAHISWSALADILKERS